MNSSVFCRAAEKAAFFPEWTGKNEDQPDVNVWEDNWDDDAVEDDFSVQLK